MYFSVIITTIFHPKILENIAASLDHFSRKQDVEVIVIGDLKSSVETSEYVSGFIKKGFHFEYWDVKAQKEWLKRFPDLDAMIPYNTDNRRNIGYLIAYERGRQCIIALDDDNYPTNDDFFGAHARVGKTLTLPTVSSKSGWFNICDMLEFEGGHRVYPRGYPYSKRWAQDESRDISESTGRIVVNAGLWLDDPDIDAVTRLNRPVTALELKNEVFVLDPSTNCPFNTQNTGFHRDIIPAYYYVVMGEDLGGLKIDRYGDIWSSYLARKVIDAMNDRVAFGTPLTRHKRHAHDLMKDLGQEYWGMVLTNRLVQILSSIQLSSSAYTDCTRELSLKLEREVATQDDLSDGIKRYFNKIFKNMRIWLDVCSDLENRK